MSLQWKFKIVELTYPPPRNHIFCSLWSRFQILTKLVAWVSTCFILFLERLNCLLQKRTTITKCWFRSVWNRRRCSAAWGYNPWVIIFHQFVRNIARCTWAIQSVTISSCTGGGHIIVIKLRIRNLCKQKVIVQRGVKYSPLLQASLYQPHIDPHPNDAYNRGPWHLDRELELKIRHEDVEVGDIKLDVPRQIKYAADVLSTWRYHFFKLSIPSCNASFTSRNLGWGIMDSQCLMRNSSNGMIRQTVGERSFENVCWTSNGSCLIFQFIQGDRKPEKLTRSASLITESLSQSFFVSWKSAYVHPHARSGTLSLASARRTNWSVPWM